MRFEIEKKDLEKSLFKATGICNSKNITNNILTHVHIEALDSRVTIKSTDRNISLISTVSAHIQEPGAILVNGKKFYEAIKELPNNIVVIEKIDNILNIACQKTNFKLFISETSLFPQIEGPKTESEYIALDSHKLHSLITRTAFCSCEQQTKFGVNGILLKLNDNNLLTVATDGHRLGLSSTTTEGNIDKELEIVIPRSSLPELLKVIPDEKGTDINILIEENTVTFCTPVDIIKTNLLKKKFPVYSKVIPDECPVEIKIPTKGFRELLKRLSIFVTENVKTVKFSITNNSLTASIQSQEYGNARENLDIEYDGKTIDIGYNIRLINEIVSHIETEYFVILLNEGLSVSMIKPFGKESSDETLYVLMPNQR
ncbi:DNA polymerase III subunit beta [Desulfurispira natronophila]|uniref:Beta sliding clamp n=1 Tax=Desulfurispira natronophila TaxID=682562 RepID=A0A7W7Y3R9_9BACT|nr:DNA polymerase III subunit beta [Desulfurispira natronophila]MBB5021488.1 DNA polymerase-3 subunit beta [Desulfurispira natronophila]